MVRLLVESCMPAGEMVGMSVDDLNLKAKVVFVVGKGIPAAALSVRQQNGRSS